MNRTRFLLEAFLEYKDPKQLKTFLKTQALVCVNPSEIENFFNDCTKAMNGIKSLILTDQSRCKLNVEDKIRYSDSMHDKKVYEEELKVLVDQHEAEKYPLSKFSPNLSGSISLKDISFYQNLIEEVRKDIDRPPMLNMNKNFDRTIEDRAIDFSNAANPECFVAFVKLGLFDNLKDKLPEFTSEVKLASLMSLLTGIPEESVRRYINAAKNSNDKNNPLKEGNIRKVRAKLTELGFEKLF